VFCFKCYYFHITHCVYLGYLLSCAPVASLRVKVSQACELHMSSLYNCSVRLDQLFSRPFLCLLVTSNLNTELYTSTFKMYIYSTELPLLQYKVSSISTCLHLLFLVFALSCIYVVS